jgi:nucleotide-binding universal stress UspA family protein
MRPSESAVPSSRATAGPGDTIFGHVLVGVDTTPESIVAAAQARCVCAPGGTLEVLAIAETHLAAHAGFSAPHAADQLVAATHAELESVRELVKPDSFRLVTGSIAETLVAEAKLRSATLVVLGAARHRRLTARLFGGPDMPLLREAPCSVLVARPGWGGRRPRRILLGVDGSPEATAAEEAARALAARFECELTPVIALGGGPIENARLGAGRDDALLDPRTVFEALSTAPEDSLVVIGSSAEDRPSGVCTHVAHEARCSVLVVRHRRSSAT